MNTANLVVMRNNGVCMIPERFAGTHVVATIILHAYIIFET